MVKNVQSRPNHLLRTARKERGWTQKNVADQIGAPLALNVTRWESGTSFPSAHYVEKLCVLFGKSARELGLLQEEYQTTEQHESAVEALVSSPGQPFPITQPMNHKPIRPTLFLIAGLIIMLVILVGSSLFYFVYARRDIPHPTPVAVSDAEATATFIAANPDPYPPHTGKFAFHDPLSKPYLWGSYNYSFGTCQFSQGSYHASVTKAAMANLCFSPDIHGGNFTFEVAMKITQGDCGGIIFRSNEPNDYSFLVCRDGYYSFSVYKGLTNSTDLVSKSSPAIVVGLDQLNVIALVANGSLFDLYVNKQKVDSIHDTSYSDGQIALAAVNSPSAGTTLTNVTYSNMKMWTM